MKKRLMILLAGLMGASSAFAYTALEDNFNNGKGGWIRCGSTSNEGGVDWSIGHPVINLNTNSGQPHAIYHDIGSIALADGDTLHPMQAAFREEHGLQCGFCTPGMIMSAIDLLQNNADTTADEIRDWLEGNLCRCTGYHNIVKSIQTAAKSR